MAGSVTFLGQSADDQFKQWIASYPHFFYLNYQRKQTWMLHRADCWHFGSGEGVKATTYSKVCSGTITDLDKWAKDNHSAITNCPDCDPRAD